MSIAISGANPAFSLESVVAAQQQAALNPPPTPQPPTAGQLPSGPPQFNNLPNTPNAGAAVTSATASVLTAGGSVSVVVKNGSGAQVRFTDAATGAVSVIANVGSYATSNVNGTNVSSGSLSQAPGNATNGITTAVASVGTINPAVSTVTGATQAIKTTTPSAPDNQDANDQTSAILSTQLSVSTLSQANDTSGHLNAFLSTTA